MLNLTGEIERVSVIRPAAISRKGHPCPIGHTTRPLVAQLLDYNARFVQNVTCFDVQRTAKMFMFNSSANKTNG
jgi:hypothetical protein